MRNKSAFVVSLTLIAVPSLISSAFASKLVDQTWLPGTVIRTTYGQYVDEVPRPGRANGANDLTITQSEFQQKMMPRTFSYPPPFTDRHLRVGFWGRRERTL